MSNEELKALPDYSDVEEEEVRPSAADQAREWISEVRFWGGLKAYTMIDDESPLLTKNEDHEDTPSRAQSWCEYLLAARWT